MTQGTKTNWIPPTIINFDNIHAVMGRLQAPFIPTVVEWRIGALSRDKVKGQALAYIDARTVRKRLNMVLGEWNWQSKQSVQGRQVICEIAILINGNWITKSDGTYAGSLESQGKGGDAKEEQRLEMDGKGAISTAFKRAAVCWGIGEYLYDIASPFVDIDQNKRFTKGAMEYLFKLAEEPYVRAREEAKSRQAAAGQPPASTLRPVPAAPKDPAPADSTPPASPGGSQTTQQSATDLALRVGEFIVTLEQAQSGDVVIDVLQELDKLKLPKGSLKEQAWAAVVKNAERLGVAPEALKKKSRAA